METKQSTIEDYTYDCKGKKFQINITLYETNFKVVIRQIPSLTNLYEDEVSFENLKESNPNFILFRSLPPLVKYLHKCFEKKEINIEEYEDRCDLVFKPFIVESWEEFRIKIKKASKSNNLTLEDMFDILNKLNTRVYFLDEENRTLKLENTYNLILKIKFYNFLQLF